jgi:uncharacterized protein YodC (DUF2158 family)
VDKEFKAGDMVQLKSGGPKMTVVEVSNIVDKVVRTSWFAGSKLSHGNFSPASIIHYVEPSKAK